MHSEDGTLLGVNEHLRRYIEVSKVHSRQDGGVDKSNQVSGIYRKLDVSLLSLKRRQHTDTFEDQISKLRLNLVVPLSDGVRHRRCAHTTPRDTLTESDTQSTTTVRETYPIPTPHPKSHTIYFRHCLQPPSSPSPAYPDSPSLPALVVHGR